MRDLYGDVWRLRQNLPQEDLRVDAPVRLVERSHVHDDWESFRIRTLKYPL